MYNYFVTPHLWNKLVVSLYCRLVGVLVSETIDNSTFVLQFVWLVIKEASQNTFHAEGVLKYMQWRHYMDEVSCHVSDT